MAGQKARCPRPTPIVARQGIAKQSPERGRKVHLAMDPEAGERSVRISHDMALAPLDPLAGIIATHFQWFLHFDCR